MKIFLDFDDVLFDTKAFLEKLQGIFGKFGISPECFHQAYQELKAESPGTGFGYSFERHLKQLRPQSTFDEATLSKELERCIANTEEFLFPDVKEFLESAKEHGYTMAILSFGDTNFQESKIRGTGVSVYVEKNIITDTDKAEALQNEITDISEEMWFFDDRVHFLESVKRAFPTIKTVLVQRKQGRFPDEQNIFCDYRITHLLEGRDILERTRK